MIYTNVQEAVSTVNKARSVWWALYMKNPKSDETKVAYDQHTTLYNEVVSTFGKVNPAYPECKQCLAGSLFGGPSHETSRYCKSGRYPHCSCDTCF